MRRDTLWETRKDKVLTPKRIVEYNQQHRALVQAIAGRDVASAVGIITRHLEEARADLIGAS